MLVTMPTELQIALDALLSFRLAEWHGLPNSLVVDVEEILSASNTATESRLGAYPALLQIFQAPEKAALGLQVFSRAGRVVAIETLEPPPLAAVAELGDPEARLSPEVYAEGYSGSEHLYAKRGLAIAIGEALDDNSQPRQKVLRCRGIRILAAAHEYGAQYYRPLKFERLWQRCVDQGV
jgi:hypothetical protein